MRKILILVVAIIMVAGIGYTSFLLINHKGAGSLTVSKLRSQVESLHDQRLRVEGRVAPSSIDWDDKAQVMSFVLTDEKETLSVVYKGTVPDDFKPGAALIVEGRYASDGTFEAFGFDNSRSFCAVCH